MSIALYTSDKLDRDSIATLLCEEGLPVLSVALPSPAGPWNQLNGSVEECVLVIREQGVMSLGEQLERLRRVIGQERRLLLCAPQPSSSDRKELLACGASEIITPQTWTIAHIVERISAQFFLDGKVQPSSSGTLRGATRRMRTLYKDIQRIAPLSEPILLLGETGTGKDLVAKEIHSRSGRPDFFVPINCAELNPELLGSELFGHKKGAFTNAMQDRKGLLAEARGGTVFLDEIGDLDLQAQAKLLRVLEDRKVRPVGANQWEDIQSRIVLATNRNLEEDCMNGKFRRDLFERIQGFSLELPPLRERKADIPLLAHHFLEAYNHEYQRELTFPPGSLDCLFRSEWPGNVRSLRAAVRKAAAYADESGLASAGLLQESVRERDFKRSHHVVAFDPLVDTWRDFLHRAQSVYFHAVLAAINGNKEEAAKRAGLSRSQLYEKLKGIKKEELPPPKSR